MAYFIKNSSGSDDVWAGQTILDGEYYQIELVELINWQTNDLVILDIASGDLVVAQDASGNTDFAPAPGVSYLLGIDPSPRDSDGSLIQRGKVTKTGWRYDPRSLDWVTSKRASLYNKKPTGYSIGNQTDIGDAVIRFWESDGTEMIQGESETDQDFQTRLTADCTATAIEWQATYDMDVIGATITVRHAPTNDCYFWAIIAPDIPEYLGGRKTFGNGGFNLSHFNDKDMLEINGRGSKTVYYDPVYNSNKFQFLCVHEAGVQVGLQIFMEEYHA